LVVGDGETEKTRALRLGRLRRLTKANVVDLLNKWLKVIVDVESPNEYWGCEDDFTNDVGVRDGIAEVLAASPPSLISRLGKVVGELDKRFYQNTFELNKPIFNVNHATKEGTPWWFRVPKRRRKGEWWSALSSTAFSQSKDYRPST
jgi:hypothetical protein